MADFSKIGLGLQGLGAGIQGQLPQFQAGLAKQRQQAQAMDDKRKMAMAKDAQGTLTLYNSGDIQGADNLLTQRIDMIGKLGGDPQDTIDIQERLRAGDPSVKGDLETFVGRATAAGYLEGPDPMAAANLAYKKAQTAKLGAETAGMGKSDNKEWLKEQRQTASSSTKSIKKRAREINTAFAKVNGLGDQMRKGGSGARAAIGAGLMSVARLISPGVVTDSDFKALSGAADPLQTAISLIMGSKNGAGVMKQMQKSIDVTNPDTFDVDALMDLAGSVIAAESPSLFNQWQESEGQAKRAGLSKAAINTFYGGDNLELEKLRKISAPKVMKFDQSGNLIK